jgi:hypothetical protein
MEQARLSLQDLEAYLGRHAVASGAGDAIV